MERKYTVLIVDDSETNIEMMSEMLRGSYALVTANNGVDALEEMRGENRPDVVLLDMLMPKPDGYDILKIMSEDEVLRFIPVVAITSDSDPAACERAFELGAVDFLSRDEDMSFIRYRVRSVLRLCEMDKTRRESERLRGEITSERRLSVLMDNLPGGVATIRTNGIKCECTYFNTKLIDLFHMGEDQFAMQFAVPKRPEWLEEIVTRAKSAENFTFEFSVENRQNYDKPGARQWIRAAADCIGEKDGMTELYCVFLDINAEKQQELRAEESGKRLRENQSLLQTVFNNAPGGICFSERGDDGSFRTLFISLGLAQMLGFSSVEDCLAVISENPSHGVSANDAATIKRLISEIPEEGGSFKYGFRVDLDNGHTLWLSMRCQLTREDDGKVHMYSFITNLTKEKRYQDELRAAAYYDSLTGLYNRHAFLKTARETIDENPLTQFSLMRLNIGSFKVVNDLLGRDVGDKVLTIIANAVRELFTDRGIYSRFFADNFLVLTPYNERGVHPRTLLAEVQKAVAESGLLSHEIQYYIGVYTVTDRSMSVENMADRAAIACRSINGSFQEHIAYYDEKMRLEMLEEQSVVDDSRRALQNGEFCVYYQPVYGIKAKKFVSAEALVRWKHPTKGMINPGRFVPVFEKNGFIAELDLYVLEQVCVYMKWRRENNLPQFPISVNISRMSLYDPKLYDTISSITDKYKIDPKFFRIEITESAYNDNPAQLLDTIGKLRGKCYPVLMDDFGSGYSSLNTLKDIPIDVLKLDMKFMQGFEKNGKVGTIVTSVARMSKWLNIPLLAEGVETKAQFDFLSSVGCAYIQGFYFARPVPEEELTRLIALEGVSGKAELETYALNDDVNELLGNNALVSKLISGAFGGFGIYEMYDNKLEALRVNNGYMKIMGYTPEDFNEENVNVWELMLPEDAELSRNACLEALRRDEAVHATVHRYDKNGNLRVLDGVHRRLGGTYENPILCIAFNDITDQLESERRLRLAYNEIEEVLGATDSVITDMDIENGVFFSVGDLSDYDIDLNKLSDLGNASARLGDVVHPDDLAEATVFSNIREPGKYTRELRLLNRKDNRYYWWRFTIVHTINDAGELARTLGVANNIDAQKRARLELEQERANVDTVMSKLDAGILTLEVSGEHDARVIYSNDSYWRITGLEKTDDMSFFENIYSGVDEEGRQRINEAVRSGGSSNVIYRVTRPNGEVAMLEMSMALTQVEGNRRVYMTIVTDISERYNDRLKFEAIVRNFHEGLALVQLSAEGVEINYANEKFYSVLGVAPEDTERIDELIQTAIMDSGAGTGDVQLTARGGSVRVVRIRVDEIGETGVDVTSCIVTASDVTLARAESKNRIAERTSNADAGLYDEVAEINYADRTTKLTYHRRDPEKAKGAKPAPLDATVNSWGGKYVAEKDFKTFEEFIFAPADNPDFTDSYCVVDVLDATGDGEYHSLGMVLVRLTADVCMLFIRDKARVDDSVTHAQIAETYRLYGLVAELTHTTVIEIDHVEQKTTCSPSIVKYYTGDLTYSDVKNDEMSKQGPIVHPDDQEKYAKFVNYVYSVDTPQSVTVRMKMADGTFKWNRLTISVSRSKDGRVLTSLSTLNVVHDEVVAREKARQTDELLRKTVSQIPMGVGVSKLEGDDLVVLYRSDYVNKIFGKDKEALEGYFDVARAFLNNKVYAEEGDEGSKVTQLKRADGTDLWVGTHYRIVNDGDSVMAYVALSDVTDQVENRLREEAREETYRMVMNGSGIMVFDYDPRSDTFKFLIHTGENETQIVEKISEKIQMFAMVPPEDREIFLGTLLKLAKTAGEEEVLIHVVLGEYPRRYKVLYKSILDEGGNIYKVVGMAQDVEDEETRLDSVRTKAMYDTLCVDIFNKQTTEEQIRAELERSTGGVLMMIDVDDFKSINDTLGHMFGDEFLKKFASTIKAEFRETDIVGRYGGDEFFVFLPRATSTLAERKAKKLLEHIRQIEVPLKDGVKSSIGLASVSPANREYKRLLGQADSALYQAKNLGKNRAVLFDSATMSEESYRTKDVADHGRAKVAQSSNPESASSIIMRVISSLYSGADVNEGINGMLAFVGKLFDVSRAYIFEDVIDETGDGLYCCNTFEWCGEGVPSEKNSLARVSYKDLGWNYRDNMDDDGIFYCHDINELPEAQREILARQGTKSVLQCAIFDNGKYKGFVGFVECRSNRFWTQDQIDSLVLISKVLSMSLMMYRTRTVAVNNALSLKSVLDNFPQMLFIVDARTLEVLYCNKALDQRFGEGQLGRHCYEGLCDGDPNETCPVKQLRKAGSIEAFSKTLNQKMTAQATEIQWNGKRAFLLSIDN